MRNRRRNVVKGTGKIWIFYDSVSQRQTKPMNTIQAQVTLLNLKSKDKQRYFLWTPGWIEWVPLQTFLESDQTFFVIAPAPTPPNQASGPQAPPPPQPPKASSKVSEDTVKAQVPLDDEITEVIHPTLNRREETFTEILDDERTSIKKTDYGYYHEDFSADKIDPDASHKVEMNLPSAKTGSGRDRRVFERHILKIEVILINKSGRTFRTHSQNISIGGTLLEEDLPKDFVNTRFDLILVNRFERDPARGRLHFQGRVVGDYANPRRLMFMESDSHTLKRLEEMLQSYARAQEQVRKKSG